jgi:hypothetical protein
MANNPCSTCRFFVPLTRESGECHFNPPPANLGSPQATTMFPMCRWTDWCGRWAAKDDAPAQHDVEAR